MKLTDERRWPRADYTIGVLFINGDRFCEILEDPIRDKKIKGVTAIPAGTYKIDMETVSPRFKNRAWAVPYKGKLPRLLDVPGYEGVLIHPGNTAADTDGCLLPGNNREKGKVLDSQTRFHQLMKEFLLPAHQAGEEIEIEIINC